MRFQCFLEMVKTCQCNFLNFLCIVVLFSENVVVFVVKQKYGAVETSQTLSRWILFNFAVLVHHYAYFHMYYMYVYSHFVPIVVYVY